MNCLREKDASKIVECYDALWSAGANRRKSQYQKFRSSEFPDFLDGTYQYFTVEMRPVIGEDLFISKCPTVALQDFMAAKNVPDLLIGNVDKEGMFWLFYGLSIRDAVFLEDDGTLNLPNIDQLKPRNYDAQKLMDGRFASVGHMNHDITDQITTFYELDKEHSNTSQKFLNKLDRVTGDMDFTCGTIYFAKIFAKLGVSKIWFFDFMHKTKNNTLPNWTGPMHGYEIEYVFGMPYSAEFRHKYYNFTENEKHLSKRVMSYWANFAKRG